MVLINCKWRIKEKEKCHYLKRGEIWMCVFLYDVKVNWNYDIRLKARMSLYSPLYSYIMLKLFKLLCRSQRKTTKKILQKSE